MILLSARIKADVLRKFLVPTTHSPSCITLLDIHNNTAQIKRWAESGQHRQTCAAKQMQDLQREEEVFHYEQTRINVTWFVFELVLHVDGLANCFFVHIRLFYSLPFLHSPSIRAVTVTFGKYGIRSYKRVSQTLFSDFKQNPLYFSKWRRPHIKLHITTLRVIYNTHILIHQD